MKTSASGIKLLHYFEGCKLKAYTCPAGVLTIGYGHTGPDVVEGLEISKARADELFRLRLEKEFEPGVLAKISNTVLQCEFDAMVSLAYNIGVAAFQKSTLLKLFNMNDIDGASAQFMVWTKAGGKELLGLKRRRYAERSVFDGHDVDEAIKGSMELK